MVFIWRVRHGAYDDVYQYVCGSQIMVEAYSFWGTNVGFEKSKLLQADPCSIDCEICKILDGAPVNGTPKLPDWIDRMHRENLWIKSISKVQVDSIMARRGFFARLFGRRQ